MSNQDKIIIQVTIILPFLQVFADLVDVKIEKHQLNDLVRKGDPPEARGAFGAVYKRHLRTKVSTIGYVTPSYCLLCCEFLTAI